MRPLGARGRATGRCSGKVEGASVAVHNIAVTAIITITIATSAITIATATAVHKTSTIAIATTPFFPLSLHILSLPFEAHELHQIGIVAKN